MIFYFNSTAIRLSGGKQPSIGAVELHSEGRWSPVCGDSWNIESGSVACRHLGYPAALNVSGIEKKVFSDVQKWTKVVCGGNESSLNRCHKQNIPYSKCGKLAKVSCKPGENKSNRELEGNIMFCDPLIDRSTSWHQ